MKSILSFLSTLTIKKKLIIPISLIMFLSMLLTVVTVLGGQRSRDMELLKTKSQRYAALLSRSNADNIWNFNTVALKASCEEFFEDPEVVKILIMDKTGQELVKLQRENIEENITEKSQIKREDAVLANLEIGFTTTYVQKNLMQIQLKIIAQTILSLILVLVVVLLVTNRVLKPLMALFGILERVSQMDFSDEVKVDTRDEIGEFANHFNSFTLKLIDTVQTINGLSIKVAMASDTLSTTLKALVYGDETSSIKSITDLKNDVEVVLDNVKDQAAATEQTAASIVEISNSVKMVAENAVSVHNMSADTDKSARIGGDSVKNTMDSIRHIDEIVKGIEDKARKLDWSSQKIGEILTVISDISEQTSLLALNAAIEAARAGEAGKGFAVVSDEIQKLASNSNEATKEIENLIKGIQQEIKEVVGTIELGYTEVKKGLSLSEEAEKNIENIIEKIDKTSSEIGTISNSVREQSNGIDEISASIENISLGSMNIQNLSSSHVDNLNEVSDSLKQLVASASDMSQVASQLEGIFKSVKMRKE
jgi:methyl-accepting chemotaxis protein